MIFVSYLKELSGFLYIRIRPDYPYLFDLYLVDNVEYPLDSGLLDVKISSVVIHFDTLGIKRVSFAISEYKD